MLLPWFRIVQLWLNLRVIYTSGISAGLLNTVYRASEISLLPPQFGSSRQRWRLMVHIKTEGNCVICGLYFFQNLGSLVWPNTSIWAKWRKFEPSSCNLTYCPKVNLGAFQLLNRESSEKRTCATLWDKHAISPCLPCKSSRNGSWEIITKHGNNRLENTFNGKAESSDSFVRFHKRTFVICETDPRSTSKYGFASNCVCARDEMSFPSMFPSTALPAGEPFESLYRELRWQVFPNARFFGAV